MSGPKQHYIPQSFQRPFQIKGEGKTERVWCYRKGQEAPFPVRIADVAAERYFYSEKPTTNNETLDDIITRYEDRLAHLLRQLRSLSGSDTVPSEVAAEVIAHLTFRAKSVRHMMNDGISGLHERLTNLLDKGFDVEDFPAAPIPYGIDEKLRENLQEHPEAVEVNLLDETLSRIAYAYAREHSEVILDNARVMLVEFLSSAKALDLRGFHAKSFTTMFPEKVFTQLSEMKWEIHEISEDLAILPDCIGVVSENGIDFGPVLGGTKSAKVIIVPIAPDKLLVASKDFEFELNIDKFNEIAVSWSSELFIANNKLDGLKTLQQKIGQSYQSVLTSAIDEAIIEFTVGHSKIDNLPFPDQAESARQYNISVCVGCVLLVGSMHRMYQG